MRFSMKMMWVCVAVFGVVVILAVAGVVGVSGAYAIAIPCLLMMGAMMWMMMRGMGGGSHHGQSDSAAETAPPPKAPLDERPVTRESPVEILERRFAEGGISPEDYRARREALVNGTAEPNGAHKDEPVTAARAGEESQ